MGGAVRDRYKLLAHFQVGDTLLNEIVIIALAGFTTGITTVLFGFGGGFVVVPLCLSTDAPAAGDCGQRHACRGGYPQRR